MPLESGTYLSDLDPSYPLGGDPTNKGDDHLRLIKRFLVQTFPGALGSGFNTAIISTEAEINFLTGLRSNVQAQIDALDTRIDSLEATLSAPVGTRLVFHQAAAPTGWTQDTTKNDYMMRVVSTAGGGSGGSDSPILNNKVPSHNHTASVTDPGHTHVTDFKNNNGIDGDEKPPNPLSSTIVWLISIEMKGPRRLQQAFKDVGKRGLNCD